MSSPASATGTFADLEQVRHHREVVVLDVRRADEFESTAIAGAVNIPIHELPRRVGEVPAGEVWVHCASGYRASIAASFLDAAGRTLVAIDDSFENAEKVGLHLVEPGEQPSATRRALADRPRRREPAAGRRRRGLIGRQPRRARRRRHHPGRPGARLPPGPVPRPGHHRVPGRRRPPPPWSSAVTAHRAGNVLLGRGVVFGLVATGGAVAGAKLSAHVPEPVLLAAFSALMLIVGGLMAYRQAASSPVALTKRRRRMGRDAPGRGWTTPSSPSPPTFACQCPRALKVLVAATVVGLLTGFLGVGGGFFVVPVLVLALGLTMDLAAGTSLVVITLTSAAALAARTGLGVTPDWGLVAALTAASTVGGLFGTRLAARLETSHLATAFTALVVAVALYTAARSLPVLL